MPRKKTKESKPVNTWWCETCRSDELSHAQVADHLKEKHGLEIKGLKGRKEMLVHMDGDTWFSSQYKWTFNGSSGDVVMTQSYVSPRSKDDMMRYE